jgi:cytochrome c5
VKARLDVHGARMVAIRVLVSCAACALLIAACARQRNPAGSELYARYCASCHGATGHGDGPASTAVNPRPADLTRSTLANADVIQRIDGRWALPGHGTSDMPVWGEVFNEELISELKAREIIRLRVVALAEHVRSLRGRP